MRESRFLGEDERSDLGIPEKINTPPQSGGVRGSVRLYAQTIAGPVQTRQLEDRPTRGDENVGDCPAGLLQIDRRRPIGPFSLPVPDGGVAEFDLDLYGPPRKDFRGPDTDCVPGNRKAAVQSQHPIHELVDGIVGNNAVRRHVEEGRAAFPRGVATRAFARVHAGDGMDENALLILREVAIRPAFLEHPTIAAWLGRRTRIPFGSRQFGLHSGLSMGDRLDVGVQGVRMLQHRFPNLRGGGSASIPLGDRYEQNIFKNC